MYILRHISLTLWIELLFQKSIHFRAAPSRYVNTNRAQQIYRLAQLIHSVFALYAHNKPIYCQGIYNVSFPSYCTTNEEKARQVMSRNYRSWPLYCLLRNTLRFIVTISTARDDTKSCLHFQLAQQQGCTLVNPSPYPTCRIVILLCFKARAVYKTKTLDYKPLPVS
jgi:hypothetical protein